MNLSSGQAEFTHVAPTAHLFNPSPAFPSRAGSGETRHLTQRHLRASAIHWAFLAFLWDGSQVRPNNKRVCLRSDPTLLLGCFEEKCQITPRLGKGCALVAQCFSLPSQHSKNEARALGELHFCSKANVMAPPGAERAEMPSRRPAAQI